MFFIILLKSVVEICDKIKFIICFVIIIFVVKNKKKNLKFVYYILIIIVKFYCFDKFILD